MKAGIVGKTLANSMENFCSYKPGEEMVAKSKVALSAVMSTIEVSFWYAYFTL